MRDHLQTELLIFSLWPDYSSFTKIKMKTI